MGMYSRRLNKSRSEESRRLGRQTETLRCAQNNRAPVTGEWEDNHTVLVTLSAAKSLVFATGRRRFFAALSMTGHG
jgi:hypothetical protein